MLILLKQTGATSTKTRLFWNTVTKATETDTITSTFTWIRGSDSASGLEMMIDAYEVGSDVVRVAWAESFTTPILVTISNAKLLSFLNESDGITKRLTFFEVSTKITQALQRYNGDDGFTTNAFDNNYTRTTTDALATQCAGVNANTWVSNGAGGVSKSVVYNSASCGFVVVTASTVVTESIVIKLDNECKDNPIYLRWLNTLGGYDSYMFYFQQEKNTAIKSKGIYETPVISLAQKSNRLERGKLVSQSIVVGCDTLTLDNYNAINPDLFISPNVCMVSTAGVEIPITISDGSWAHSTRDNLHIIEFEIELPKYFSITQ